jgi:hypothetical protein
MKTAVGIWFVVLAVKTCAPAAAQDVEQPTRAAVRQVDPQPYPVFSPPAPMPSPGGIRPDDRLQRALDMSLPLSELTPTASDEESSRTGTECDQCADGCSPNRNNACPCFYGQVDVLFLQRVSLFTNQPVVVDAISGTTLLSTSSLNSSFAPGLQATFGMRLGCGRALEFNYLGLFAGSTSAFAVSPGPGSFLIFGDNLAGNVFVGFDRAQLNLSSGLQSFAMNLPCCCGCCDCCEGCDGQSVARCRSFSWFTGIRYLNLSERLNIAAQSTVGGAPENGSYNVRTTNNLFGPQIGARARSTRGRWGWDATGTVGIFGNSARQTQTVTDFPNFVLRPTVSNSKVGAAFVGWTNVSGLYLLNNVWNLRAGYNVLWIQGLALTQNQLDFNFATSPSGNQLNRSGGLLLHGVNVGLEARW